MPAKPKPIKDRQVKQLTANPNNPRKGWINDKKKADFLRSLKTFGDLSGIVFNLTSQQLVGGHKRVAEFKDSGKSTLAITERLKTPDSTGSVAYGQVIAEDGTRFAYREVQWDAAKEAAANLAANKWGAEWDMAKVRELLEDAKSEIDLSVTGFDLREVAPWLLPSTVRESDGTTSASSEINVDAMTMGCKCPECSFEFDEK